MSRRRRYLRFLWSHESFLHRRAVRLANGVLARIPFRLKYALGARLRRGRPPYDLIRPGDVVVQVGAPHDTLRSGRSRAFYFGLFAGPAGRAIVVEPDAASAQALERAARAHGHGNVTVVRAGAWKERTTLRIHVDDRHPASNFTAGSKRYDEQRMRDYRTVEVPAVRLDEALRELGVEAVRLVSITTNGAEREILEGMTGLLGPGAPYVALADTGAYDPAALEAMGYRLLSFDDRGRTFEPTRPEPTESRAR